MVAYTEEDAIEKVEEEFGGIIEQCEVDEMDV